MRIIINLTVSRSSSSLIVTETESCPRGQRILALTLRLTSNLRSLLRRLQFYVKAVFHVNIEKKYHINHFRINED
jgi:hypothetical protein